jgi:UDP-glucose 4-epimerase
VLLRAVHTEQCDTDDGAALAGVVLLATSARCAAARDQRMMGDRLMAPGQRILVTGGAGFIGSHLCAALSARGDEVRVLDDLSTGRPENLPPDVTLLRGDIADPTILRQAFEGVGACFHLAAVASVERGVRDWLGTHRTNLSGTIAVFDAARAAAVPVVYASSAAVYGDAATIPIRESAPLMPLSAYGADKLGCELHARVAGRTHGVPTAGLRFFNVFGPRQDPGSPYSGVISIFCDRIRRGVPVTIHGDGEQTRDFIHVTDVVNALLAALPVASCAAPVFNVCTGEACSVQRLAEEIAALRGVPLEILRAPGRQGDIRSSIGDADNARTALGLRAHLPLRQGLRSVLDWMDDVEAERVR